MSFTKTYIGKGKKVAKLDIIAVSINMAQAEEFIFEYEGQRYLKFEIAALKEADKFGKTHTAYISQRQKETPTAEEPKPKSTRKAKAKQTA